MQSADSKPINEDNDSAQQHHQNELGVQLKPCFLPSHLLNSKRGVLVSIVVLVALFAIHRETSITRNYQAYLSYNNVPVLQGQAAKTVQVPGVVVPQQLKKLKLNKTSASFAGCIMLKEDNYWLSEWLPYHYQTARLRNLIVVVDRGARTSPKQILDRWKNRINIVQWKEKDFLEKRYEKKKNKKNPARALTLRQLAFYRSCILHFKKRNKSWLLLTDPDEFLRPSYNNNNNNSVELDTSEEGYLADFLESTASDRKCLTVPRYQVSSEEDNQTQITADSSENNNNELPTFNKSNFLTFRWMYHNAKTMNHGKSIVNLKTLDKKQVPRTLHSAHEVIKGVCPPNPPGGDNSIALQHYLGTWEQFSFREDPRNSKFRLDRWKVAGRNGVRVRDTSMSPWLNGFVQHVGLSEAEHLLRNVGVVDDG